MPDSVIDTRVANLLGALATRLTDAQVEAFEPIIGLGGAAPAALIAIGQFPGERVRFFAPVLGLTDAGTVRLIGRLERSGLVMRAEGSDRRSQALHLTTEGRVAADRIRDARRDVLADALSPLGLHAVRQLGDLLEPVIAALPTDRIAARRMCRLCDHDVCDGPDICPADNAVTAAGFPGWPGPP